MAKNQRNMKTEIINIDRIFANLDKNSTHRLSQAGGRIRNVLGVEDSWLEFMTKINFWEWATKFYWDNNKMPVKEFASLFFLLTQIRNDNKIKVPIVLARTCKDNKWFLRNGCHRLSIAKEIGITEIPVSWHEET